MRIIGWKHQVARGDRIHGWRYWYLLRDPDNPILHSPIYYTPWQGPSVRASNWNETEDSGIYMAPAPDIWCTDGFRRPYVVIGRVSCAPGTEYVAHARGARCERVIIDCLYVHPFISSQMRTALSDRYHCFVRTFRPHPHEKKKHYYADYYANERYYHSDWRGISRGTVLTAKRYNLSTITTEENVTIRSTATIHRYVRLGAGTFIDSHAYIHRHVQIGPRCLIGWGIVGEGTTIDEGVVCYPGHQIGAHCVIQPHVTIRFRVQLEGGVRVEPGVTIASRTAICYDSVVPRDA